MFETLSRSLWIVAAAGVLALIAALLPSPMRAFDFFDAPAVVEVRTVPAVKLRALPPATAYDDVIARPLFNAGRKPDPAVRPAAAVASASSGGAGELSAFRVVGIVADSTTQRAIVERNGAPSMRVGPGDKLGEWRIDRIDAAGIVASRDQRSVRLQIPKARTQPGTP
ncbi:MAG: hypothetical protein ACKVRO_04695 [Micropepsaceae bacterium]